MAKTIIREISVKNPATKLLGKPPPGDKTLALKPETHFYELERGDNIEEG